MKRLFWLLAVLAGASTAVCQTVTLTSNGITSTPVTITGAPGVTLSAGIAPPGAAGTVVYATDPTFGYAEVNEAGKGLSRVCTASNGVCGAAAGIANTTATVGVTAVAAKSCGGAVTVTLPGLATTSVVFFTPTTDVSSVTGWGPATPGLYIQPWVSAANTLSYKVCNSSAASITPSAPVTFNVGAK